MMSALALGLAKRLRSKNIVNCMIMMPHLEERGVKSHEQGSAHTGRQWLPATSTQLLF